MRGHTMEYEIKRENWNNCKICNKNLEDLAKVYGGSNVYYKQVFSRHLNIEHKISTEEYFENYCNISIPICCNICNKKMKLNKRGSQFKWKKSCGRTEGLLKWSKDAKISRKGSGNPMYNKRPWNKGLTKETSNSILCVSSKLKNRIISDTTKNKQSKSAKKRKVHGHTGRKHSKEAIQKMRENTLRMISEGKYKQTDTEPNRIFEKLLKDSGIEYEKEKIRDYYSFDFYLPKMNLYVEIDGDYFHSNPKFYPNGPKTKTQKINYYRDKKKNQYCVDNKINIIRFWENDIINNIEMIKECIQKKLSQ